VAADESSLVATAPAAAAAAHTRSNVKVVKTEENEDTMTQHHDDKSNLEQQQGPPFLNKKACAFNSVSSSLTDVAAADDDINKAINKTTKKKKVQLKKCHRSVNFNETVTVIPIPTKDEYSNRIKSKLWTNKYEMMERIGTYMYMRVFVFLPHAIIICSRNICLFCIIIDLPSSSSSNPLLSFGTHPPNSSE
jgi:ubiquitin